MKPMNGGMAAKIWYIAYPFLFYYAVMLVIMTLAQWVIGSDNEHFVACQLIATLITIPFMTPFYRQDQALAGIPRRRPEVTKKKMVFAVLVVVVTTCIGIGLNNIISMTPLVSISVGYQEANAGFYGSTLVLELLSSALFTPILEELVFRGILFTRLKGVMPRVFAVPISAILFAMMHFNIVQFIYAFLLGIVLALLMERGQSVFYAMLGHMTVNLIAVIRTETGILNRIVAGDAFSWIISVFLLATGLIVLHRFTVIQSYSHS